MATPLDKRLISLNPANGRALGCVDITPVADIHSKVQSARNAQADWAALHLLQRAHLLGQAATAVLANAPGLGALLCEETGIPRQAGLRQVQTAARGVASTLEAAMQSQHCHPEDTYQDPLGTCAIITPCDSPVALAHRWLIPALVAGNTAVWKPSPETPLICQQLADIYQRFLPTDVLQIVHGREQQGQALVAANVQLIAFSGSTAVGKHIMAGAAFGLKRILLALGSKNNVFVLADADLDSAALYAVQSSLGNHSRCIATERVFVDARVAHDLENRIAGLCGGYRIGSWENPNTHIGPMINTARRERVIKLLLDAMGKGAQALVGGANHPDFYIRPTVLTQVNEDMDIVHKEILGPVLCVSHFTGLQDAVALANRSPFAQAAAVFGGDGSAFKVARQLDAAAVAINKGIADDDLPWFGAKQSGLGYGPGFDVCQPFTQSRRLYR
jgi:acyl-CoA reductase-like NAD-dependent aldehyde dehydrogenase